MDYARKHEKNKKGVGELCECGFNGTFGQMDTPYPQWLGWFDSRMMWHQIRGEKKQCRECKKEEMFWISQNKEGFWKNIYNGPSKFLGIKSVRQPMYSYHPENGKMWLLTLEEVKKFINEN